LHHFGLDLGRDGDRGGRFGFDKRRRGAELILVCDREI